MALTNLALPVTISLLYLLQLLPISISNTTYVNPDVTHPIKHFKLKLTKKQCDLRDSVIKYLSLKQHGISLTPKYTSAGCHLFGSWLAYLKQGNNQTKVFLFTDNQLNPYLLGLCNELSATRSLYEDSVNQGDFNVNKDSLVDYYLTKQPKTDTDLLLPPPLKSTVKFNPPE